MMGCWLKKSRENIHDNVIVTDVELKILMNCEKCAKKIRKIACQFEGVKSCITDVDNQKVMVIGDFNLEKLLKTLKKKTGKKIEILMKNEKSNEDDKEKIEENDDKDEIVPENNEGDKEKLEENDGKSETSIIEVEFNIPFLSEKYKKDFEKVISKCKGVETYVVDVENKKVVVIGNFDKEELLRELNKKMHQKIEKAEKERKEREAEMMLKEAEERKKTEEIYEEIDKDRNIFLQPKTEYEEEIAKYYHMFSDENPKACFIS